MANIESYCSAKYLRACDLDGNDATLTIKEVGQAKYDDDTTAPLLHWQEPGVQPLGCNRTNTNTMIALFGNDTEAMVGKQVTLYPATVETAGQFFGQPCIRIRQSVPRESPPVESPPDSPAGSSLEDYRARIALVKASRVASLFEDLMRDIVGDKSLDGADMKALADDVQKAREAMGS